MVEVIGAAKREPKKNPAKSGAGAPQISQVVKKKDKKMAGTTGLEPSGKLRRRCRNWFGLYDERRLQIRIEYAYRLH